MNEKLNAPKAGEWLRTSAVVRIIVVGILVLLLMIPVSMVENLIHERQFRYDDAIHEVTAKWGNPQTVGGPYLSIPYYGFVKTQSTNGSSQLEKRKLWYHFLPEKLDIQVKIDPEQRHRGIYDVVVYQSQIQLKGGFLTPDFSKLGIEAADILWDQATLNIGISDLRGITNNEALRFNQQSYQLDAGLSNNDLMKEGISVKIKLDTGASELPFAFKLHLKGSSQLQFLPLGKTTRVSIASAWSDPSFKGAFLPDSPLINNDGFVAQWKVLHLNRNYGQSIQGSQNAVDESAFGVQLMLPVDQYQKSIRSAKYAILLIGLTFLVFFFSQTMKKIKIHPVQYLLVGLALVLFYTLLISFSEHLGFNWAYLLATVLVTALVTFYTQWIFSNKRMVALLSLMILMLYGFIFTLIQLQEYSLLMGSMGLFVVLAIVMYISRKIDWYNITD